MKTPESSKRFLSALFCGLLSSVLVQTSASGQPPTGSILTLCVKSDPSMGSFGLDSGVYGLMAFEKLGQTPFLEEDDRCRKCPEYREIEIRGYTQNGQFFSGLKGSFALVYNDAILFTGDKPPKCSLNEAASQSGMQERQTPTETPAPTGEQDSISDRLKALKKLEDAGLISKEEAAAKRKEILKNL